MLNLNSLIMKPESMAIKMSNLNPLETEAIIGGHAEDKTYDGGTLQEVIVTPDKMM